ncbi:MAG: NlpC/P60 family protein [Myxococcota bacterium]
MDHELSESLAAAAEDLEALEARLRARHGVSRIDVELRPDAAAREVAVVGVVLVDRLRTPVLDRVRERLAPWTVTDAMAVVQGGPWLDVPMRRVLRAASIGGAAVTVLHPEDGPVEVLWTVEGALLVRDRCGTVGWTQAALGSPAPPPVLPTVPTCGPASFVAAACRYEGTPYELAGTDRAAIDCSGLVQRAAWSTMGLALPRNSGDLWSLGARPGPPPAGAGHLVFTWTAGESLRHVGICTPNAVVHASASRRRVVLDPVDAFVRAAERIEHVPFEALLAHGRRCAGHPNILAAGVRLGEAGLAG